MTQEEQTLLLIKGTIAGLPQSEQDAIYDFYRNVKKAVEDRPLLGMAIALLGADMAAQN